MKMQSNCEENCEEKYEEKQMELNKLNDFRLREKYEDTNYEEKSEEVQLALNEFEEASSCLDTLQFNDDYNIDYSYHFESTMDRIFDFSLTISERCQYIVENIENITEIISKLKTMALISPIEQFEDYLIYIIECYKIDIFSRLDCIDTLLTINQCVAYELLYVLFIDNEMVDLARPRYYSYCLILLNCDLELYQDYAIELLKLFFTDQNVSITYRYKLLTNLDSDEDIEKIKNRKQDFLFYFIFNEKHELYKLFACQQCMNNPLTYDIIKEIVKTTNNDVIKAEACDLLLTSQTPKDHDIAMSILMELGKSKSIYENKQNVHFESIEKSAMEGIGKIIKLSLKSLTYEYVKNDLMNFIKDYENEDFIKLESVFYRIEIDRVLYVPIHQNLQSILCKIYSYIETFDKELQDELKNRLIEEMKDMAGTCSSGFLTRMVNCLTGYTDVGIFISFEDQIKASLHHTINSYIMNLQEKEYIYVEDNWHKIVENRWCKETKITRSNEGVENRRTSQNVEIDERDYENEPITESSLNSLKRKEKQEDIILEWIPINRENSVIDTNVNILLYELTEETDNKKMFNDFMIVNFLTIRNEMFEEYKSCMSEGDFDFYIYKAFIHYTSGNVYEQLKSS